MGDVYYQACRKTSGAAGVCCVQWTCVLFDDVAVVCVCRCV